MKQLRSDEIPWERFKGVHCVDLGESFPTNIYLLNLASIQPRTSLVKFARRSRRWERGRPKHCGLPSQTTGTLDCDRWGDSFFLFFRLASSRGGVSLSPLPFLFELFLLTACISASVQLILGNFLSTSIGVLPVLVTFGLYLRQLGHFTVFWVIVTLSC